MSTSITGASEREFGISELFFSTTDRKGIIRSGNAVFARVADYTVPELIGRPHNIIRHPDMPRIAFKALWDHLEAGQPIAAYVKNRAHDGRHYWVVATVVPITDGYLSVRFKPSGPHFAAIQGVYRELRAIELQIEQAGGSRKKAMEASGARLGEILGSLGLSSYDDFMHAFLPAEVTSRETLLQEHRSEIAAMAEAARTAAGANGNSPALRDILASCGSLRAYLDGLMANLDRYVELGGTLSGKSEFMMGLAERVRMFALNALIASSRVEGAGATLQAVASLMRERSDGTAALIRDLSGDIDAAVELLGDLAFRISVAKLQTETAAFFVTELLTGSVEDRGSADDAARIQGDVCALTECLHDGLGRVFSSIGSLDRLLLRIAGHADRLGDALGVLSVLQTNGRIEAARVANATAFEVLFAQVQEQLAAAEAQMTDFSGVSALAGSQGVRGREDEVRSHLDSIAARARALH